MEDSAAIDLAIRNGCTFWHGDGSRSWFAIDAPYDNLNAHPEAGQPGCPKWWDEAPTREEAARKFCARHHLTPDIVDVFYRPLVQPLGNLVILFAQAEAALLNLVATLKNVDERQAQAVFKSSDAKDQVVALVRTSSGLQGFELSELLAGIEAFWADKDRRNRY